MVEYGFSLEDPSHPTRANPWHKNLTWQALITESTARWVRHDVWNIYDSGDIAMWKEFMETIHALGFKNIVVVNDALGSGFTLNDYRLAIRQIIKEFGYVVNVIDIWNEPDMPQNQFGYQNGSSLHLFNMLRVAREEVIAANSPIKIIIGSFETLKEKPIDNGGTILKELFQVHNAGAYCDGVSIHVYQYWLDEKGIDSKGAVEFAYNYSNKPVYVTEMGFDGSEQDQNDWLVFNVNNMSGSKGLAVFIWYNFCSQQWGIIDPTFTPRPAYESFKSFSASANVMNKLPLLLAGLIAGLVLLGDE